MPYSPPGVVAPSLPTSPHTPYGAHTRPPPRPAHRRSYTFAADDPRAGPGAFGSLGALPRRTHSHSGPRKFHFGGGDAEDSSSESDEHPVPLHPLHPSHQLHTRQPAHHDDDDGPLPPLRLRTQPPAFRLTPMTGHRASPPRSPQRSPNSSFANVPSALSTLHVPVPFPRSSSLSPSPLSPASPTFATFDNHLAPPRSNSASGAGFPTRPPGPSRTSSTPIILSNGKPLKSSLKSSKSAPHVASQPSFHLRAQSAPTSPNLGGVPGASWDASTSPTTPGTPKAVHFPPPNAGLEDIRLFKRSARPASVSFPLSLEEETETETETDRDAPRIAAWGGAGVGVGERGAGGEWVGEGGAGFPFPKVGRSPLGANTKDEKKWRYVLEAPGVPRAKEAADMVRVERVWLESSEDTSTTPELTLHGTLLARNAAFEKHLFVRFTLDGWATTSEVGARYLAPQEKHAGEEEEAGPGWDRFGFSVRLTDFAGSPGHTQHLAGSLRGIGRKGQGLGRGLEGRTLVLVARFWAPWVKEGGVGPYVWCDTLPPHLHTGGGGAGEWWDNNGGRNYEVGFRCVDVEEPAPTTTTTGQQNVIPFPTSTSSSEEAVPAPTSTPRPISVSAPPAPPTLTLTTSTPPAPTQNENAPAQTPTQTKPIPPPPPPRTAHAQALAAKLGRLSLRNYAAPARAAVPGVVSVPSTIGAGNKREEGKEKEEEQEKEGKLHPAPGTQSSSGVGLYWPWGRASAPVSPPAPLPVPQTQTQTKEDDSSSASDASEDEDDEDEAAARRDAEAGLARRMGRRGRRASDETPPTSPLGAGGLLPVIEGLVPTGDEKGSTIDEKHGEEKEGEETTPTLTTPTPMQGKEAKDVPLPASPPLVSPASSPPSSASSSPGSGATSPNSSMLYKAFVRQWCFAGAGNGSGNGNGGAAAGTAAAAAVGPRAGVGMV
ncbi:hypothetical protein C8R45DRAFT_567485 [Mycena sanguinolenta]|nr:hypothetical protein C8R45DRAFT_567485 [Mycena sanguinolenta]